MADFLTFANLVDECERGLKQYGGAKADLVKHMINMVYINEILTVDKIQPLFWLVDFDDTLTSKDPSNISAITAADPGVITTDAAHGLAVDDIISIYDIVGMTELNNRMVKVETVPTSTTLDVIDLEEVDAIDTSGYTTYVSGGVINHRGIPLATSGKNVQRILRCAWDDQEEMTTITDKELEETTAWWDSSTELPRRYYHRKKYTTAGAETNNLLWFNCADDAYNLRYWFEMRPSKLVEDADVPLLPSQFHYTIVAGVMTRLGEQQAQTESPSMWPQLYLAQLEAIKQFNRKWYNTNEHFLRP